MMMMLTVPLVPTLLTIGTSTTRHLYAMNLMQLHTVEEEVCQQREFQSELMCIDFQCRR